MNRKSVSAMLALGLFAAAPLLHAADPAGLARNSGCLACHTVDKKIVGPAFKEVAAKYKGDAAAPADLVKKVKAGGSGVWGPVPMPPNAAVSDEDMKAIVDWVLAQ